MSWAVVSAPNSALVNNSLAFSLFSDIKLFLCLLHEDVKHFIFIFLRVFFWECFPPFNLLCVSSQFSYYVFFQISCFLEFLLFFSDIFRNLSFTISFCLFFCVGFQVYSWYIVCLWILFGFFNNSMRFSPAVYMSTFSLVRLLLNFLCFEKQILTASLLPMACWMLDW